MTASPLLDALAWISLICALLPAAIFLWNLPLYRAPATAADRTLPSVSVLIPARNEELSIANALNTALASTGIDFEVIVLDDSSTDRTASIVNEIASRDHRVRLEAASPLPAGWNGKQHACWLLASLARNEVLCFVDADVRLSPSAIADMSAFLIDSRSKLASGFPLQQTETPLEWLLLPLIHFVLLGFLPLAMMRRTLAPAYAAGCGQFLLVDRAAYKSSGGHAAIRTTMHDGIRLPALFREHGFRTDLADITSLATCRMYRSTGEVWRGLAKNATEGLAAPARIVPFTLLLGAGQVLPAIILSIALASHRHGAARIAAVALILSYLPRLLSAARFQQRPAGALLHPFGVLLLLILEWYALVQKLRGRQTTWKQRSYP